MNYKIRNEQQEDFYKVEEIVRESFWNLYQPGCEEHLIVHHLRKSKDFVPDLTFVMEVRNEIVGYLTTSFVKIKNKTTEKQMITFTVICISPKHQGKGLGKILINYSINEARRKGYTAVFIAGHRHIYERYGFEGTKKYGVCFPDGKYYKGLMVLPLISDGMKEISGSLYFSESLYVTPEDVEQFDKRFSYKEKKIKESHIKEQKARLEIDES